MLRTEVLELIQYKPATPTVLSTPLLIIPPVINKYYVIDLAAGRSLVEFLVQQGVQVFTVSWRNPDARHRDWGFDTYARGILDALDGVRRVTGAERAVLFGACSGGIVSSMTAAHLATVGDSERLAGLTLVVTVLDQSRAGVASSVVDRRTANAAAAVSARKGYLDGRTLAEVFAWLRPGDLIWNYWVNNYLEGKAPPKFDLLYWNADTTRMAAKLHRDFVDAALHHKFAKAGVGDLFLEFFRLPFEVARRFQRSGGCEAEVFCWSSAIRSWRGSRRTVGEEEAPFGCWPWCGGTVRVLRRS